MPTCDNYSEMKDPLDLVDNNNLLNQLRHGTADLGPGDDVGHSKEVVLLENDKLLFSTTCR